MGSAVSGVTNIIGGITGGASGAAGGIIGSSVTPILGSVGGALGSGLGALAQGIISAIPDIPIANQSAVNDQIANQNQMATQLQGQANNFTGMAYGAYDEINPSYLQAQKGIGQAQQALGQGNQAVQDAQYVNNGQYSNNNQALNLVQNTALGQGPAQQAARAQLQAGTDQAIRSQQAMANSGNLSQMVSGQKNAMDNAAQLQQQNALNATALQAQVTAQQNQTAQQQNLMNASTNAAQGYNAGSINAGGNALTGQTNTLGIEQTALGQTGQNKAMAVGGVLNAAGGAGSAMAMSDASTKTDIQYASGPRAGMTLSSSDNIQNNSPQSQGMRDDQKNNLIKQMSNSFHLGGSTPQWNMVQSDENTKTDIEYATPKDKAKAISKSFGDKLETEQEDKKEEANSEKPKGKWEGGAQAKSELIKNSFLSDETKKTDIGKDNKVSSFLDAIDPVSFKYKDPTGEMGKTPGEHIGVIAQQIEKAPGGKSMIVETPEGKGIDLASAVGTLLAAAAESHNRVQELEDLFKSKMEKRKK